MMMYSAPTGFAGLSHKSRGSGTGYIRIIPDRERLVLDLILAGNVRANCNAMVADFRIRCQSPHTRNAKRQPSYHARPIIHMESKGSIEPSLPLAISNDFSGLRGTAPRLSR